MPRIAGSVRCIYVSPFPSHVLPRCGLAVFQDGKPASQTKFHRLPWQIPLICTTLPAHHFPQHLPAVTRSKNETIGVAPGVNSGLPDAGDPPDHAASPVDAPVPQPAPAPRFAGTGRPVRRAGRGDICRPATLRLHQPRTHSRIGIVVPRKSASTILHARPALS